MENKSSMVNVLVGTNHRVKILEVMELAIKLRLKSKKDIVNVNGMTIVMGKAQGKDRQRGIV